MRYCCQSFITVFKMPKELFNLEQVLCQHVGLVFFIGSVRNLDSYPGRGSCWFHEHLRSGGSLQYPSYPQGGATHKCIISPRYSLPKAGLWVRMLSGFFLFRCFLPHYYRQVAIRVKTPVVTANRQLFCKEEVTNQIVNALA